MVGQRLAYNLLWLLSFAVGSLGALLLFNWPPYLKSLLSAIFLTIVVAILWGALARFLLSPNNPNLRVFPTSDASARHWSRWDVILLAWFFGGYMAMQVLQDFDVDRPVRLPIAYFLGMVLFLLAMVALWRRPALSKASEERRSRAFNVTLGVSVLFAAFWALWFFGMMKAFWLLLVVAGLPAAISVVDRSVDHVLTPPGSEAAKGPPSVRRRGPGARGAGLPDHRGDLAAGVGLGGGPGHAQRRRDDLDQGLCGGSSTRSSSCSWPISPGTSSER